MEKSDSHLVVERMIRQGNLTGEEHNALLILAQGLDKPLLP